MVLACLGTMLSLNWLADFLFSGRCGGGTVVDGKLPLRAVFGETGTSTTGEEVMSDCFDLGEDCIPADKGGECLDDPRGGKLWLMEGDVGVCGLDLGLFAAPASNNRLFCDEDTLGEKFPALSTKTSAPGP